MTGIGQTRRRRRRRRAPRRRARGFRRNDRSTRRVAGRVETRPRVCAKNTSTGRRRPRRARYRAAAAKKLRWECCDDPISWDARSRARRVRVTAPRRSPEPRRFLRFLSRCACSRSRGLTLSRALRRPRLNARARGRPRVDARAWAFVTHLDEPECARVRSEVALAGNGRLRSAWTQRKNCQTIQQDVFPANLSAGVYFDARDPTRAVRGAY